MIDLKKLYDEHPECFEDRSKFSSYLLDLYPEEKGQRYILCTMLTEGVLNLVKSGDSWEINRFYAKLADTYGFEQSKMTECYQLFAQLMKVEETETTVKNQTKRKTTSAPKSGKSKTITKANKELKFPKFSETYIRSELSSPKFLVRGRAYFQQGRVHHLTCNKSMTEFESDVDGSYDNSYHCTLYVNRNQLEDCECECEAYASIPGPCKHIVATMLAITERRLQAERDAKAEQEKRKLEIEKEVAVSKSDDSVVQVSSVEIQEKIERDNRKTVEQLQHKEQKESSAFHSANSSSDTSGFKNTHQYPLGGTDPKKQDSSNSDKKTPPKDDTNKMPWWMILIVILVILFPIILGVCFAADGGGFLGFVVGVVIGVIALVIYVKLK